MQEIKPVTKQETNRRQQSHQLLPQHLDNKQARQDIKLTGIMQSRFFLL
jgi:hypothetical protein